ncbi:MAG: hypothetical protein ACLT8E_06035 [Akkermansia sp.]
MPTSSTSPENHLPRIHAGLPAGTPIGRSDVKYHWATPPRATWTGRTPCAPLLQSQPPEAVIPWVEGQPGPCNDNLKTRNQHGRSSSTGTPLRRTGFVAEVFNLPLLKGYRTGGTAPHHQQPDRLHHRTGRGPFLPLRHGRA